jgi:hypothetical protein
MGVLQQQQSLYGSPRHNYLYQEYREHEKSLHCGAPDCLQKVCHAPTAEMLTPHGAGVAVRAESFFIAPKGTRADGTAQQARLAGGVHAVGIMGHTAGL